MPAAPARASTVLVIRDGGDGVEVYLQRRPRRMQFAGGLWVFPGGRVDDADRDPLIDRAWTGPTVAAWADLLGVPPATARGHVVAAYRETLEEAGMLLVARPPASDEVAQARAALLAGTRSFAQVVADLGVQLDTGLLRYWAWWVTPEAEPRRYDTRFFLARLPVDAVVTPHTGEAVEERWARDVDGDPQTMLPPTYYTMRDALALPNVEAAMAAATRRVVSRIQPDIEDDTIVLPWDDRYRLPTPPSP